MHLGSRRVAHHWDSGHGVFGGDRFCRRPDVGFGSAVDNHVNAFPGECLGAGPAKPPAGRHKNGLSASNSEIHVQVPLFEAGGFAGFGNFPDVGRIEEHLRLFGSPYREAGRSVVTFPISTTVVFLPGFLVDDLVHV